MAAQERDVVDWSDVFIGFLFFLVGAVVVALVCLFGYLLHLGWLQITSGDTEYTVTITGVDGLDPAALERRSDLSPVFDIAVRIDNTLNKAYQRCIGMHSSAVVSYADAVLGKGTFPEFCAPALGVAETTATPWAMDVRMPRFLRNRLAGEMEKGEAVLDVAVRAPGCGNCYEEPCIDDAAVLPPGRGICYVYRCMDQLLVCKVNIGGGQSPPCLVTDVDPRSTATNSFES